MQKIDFKSKKTQLIAGALVVLAAVGGYWWYTKDKDDKKETTPTPTTPKTLPALSNELAAVTEGALDYATPDQIIGWAGNKSTLKPVALDVYVDDKKVDTIAENDADRTDRQDITQYYGGGTLYGYVIPTPKDLSVGTHTISVKFAGTSTQVQGSPKTVTIA